MKFHINITFTQTVEADSSEEAVEQVTNDLYAGRIDLSNPSDAVVFDADEII